MNRNKVRNTISLNGMWDVALTPDGLSDAIPQVFDHRIPVPGLWPLLQPAEEYRENGVMWYKTTYHAPKRLPPRVVLRIAKAEFGRTIFVNGKKVDYYPYNFSASETDIRPHLKAGADNEIVIRVKSAADVLNDGSPTAHNGSDYERITYQMGLYDDVSIIESGWPAVRNLETCASLGRGVVRVRATLFNGSASPVNGSITFSVGHDKVKVQGEELAAGEERQVTTEIALTDFNRERDSWTPEHPRLYTITAETRGDALSRRFGMRTFKVNPQKKCFMLNGQQRFLTGTNTDLFRFLDDPQCGSKPWDEKWMRQLFSEFKRIGWDSFRNCISAAPEMWYDLCDEMGLMIQDEYPFWVCGDRHRVHPCPCTPETLLPEYTDWLRDRGTHPSIVIIDLQNESFQGWFIDLKNKLKPLDFQERPFEIGWTADNPDKNDVREYHPYFFINSDFSLGYLNSCDGYVHNVVADDGLAKIINEYGWNWLNRNGDPTSLSVADYAHTLPAASRRERLDYYAWSVGILTEYWRTRSDIAGIHHFTSLTYSFDEARRAYTGDILCPDLSQPVIRPEVFDRFHSAFAPVTVVVDDYLEDAIAGNEREIPIVLLNESRNNQGVSRHIKATLTDASGQTLMEKTFTLAAEPHGRAVETIKVNIPPEATGTLVFTASTADNVRSIRRWKVLHREPDFALGCPATASTALPREHAVRPAACVTDGSPLTRWVSVAGDGNPWLCIDLGEQRQISQCLVSWYIDRGKMQSPTKVYIAISDDGEHFQRVTGQDALRTAPEPVVAPDEHPDFSARQRLTFPKTTARYVRIEGQGPLPAELMSVTEVEIR
ncbi:MAG: discoidin domain-containing protein [Bacteroidaceae bacterium]|nr:discoidin domain-containing protein [Bacteroidaceae bacterium]